MKKVLKSPAFWIVLILVIAGSVLAWQRLADVQQNQQTAVVVERPPLPVQAVQARRGDVQAYVMGEGTARAVRREFLNFEASGKVVLIGQKVDGGEIREGCRVYGPQPGEQFGQLLAQLDQREIKATINMEKAALEQARQNVKVAHATVSQAENEYALARADFERVTRHSQEGTTIMLREEAVAQAKEHVAAAEAAVAQAESDFELAKAELERTRKLSKAGTTIKAYEEALAQARQNLASAEAAVQRAENDFELARSDFEKAQNLHEDGIISKSQFDEARTRFLNAESALKTAQANYEAARSQVKSAENELEKARINVPVAELASAQARYQNAEATLNTARANLQGARSQLKTAETQLQQAKIDVPVVEYETAKAKYLNAEAALETAVANLQSAQSQVEASLARLHQAELSLERTSIFAPFDGIITYLNIKVGDYVTPQTMNTASEQTMMQTAPIVLIDPSEYEVTLNLPAFVGGEVQPGQPAQIIPSSGTYPEELDMPPTAETQRAAEPAPLFENVPLSPAKVYSVSPSISPGRRSTQIKLRTIAGTDYLQDGMFVTARIVVAEKTNTVVLPVNSMIFRENTAFVFVVDPETSTATRRPITLGIGDMRRQEVLDGVKEGELVVAEGRYRLVDGAKVEVLE